MDHERARARLEERLSALLQRVGRIESDLRQPGSPDFEERAIEAEDEEVLERLDESERLEIERIRAALQRIEQGSYGTCESCGEAIEERRLEALMDTTLCVECAE